MALRYAAVRCGPLRCGAAGPWVSAAHIKAPVPAGRCRGAARAVQAEVFNIRAGPPCQACQ